MVLLTPHDFILATVTPNDFIQHTIWGTSVLLIGVIVIDILFVPVDTSTRHVWGEMKTYIELCRLNYDFPCDISFFS